MSDFWDELAALAVQHEQTYRASVAQMSLREVHAALRRERRRAAYCRAIGRGDMDLRYKIEALRARRDALGGGRG